MACCVFVFCHGGFGIEVVVRSRGFGDGCQSQWMGVLVLGRLLVYGGVGIGAVARV